MHQNYSLSLCNLFTDNLPVFKCPIVHSLTAQDSGSLRIIFHSSNSGQNIAVWDALGRRHLSHHGILLSLESSILYSILYRLQLEELWDGDYTELWIHESVSNKYCQSLWNVLWLSISPRRYETLLSHYSMVGIRYSACATERNPCWTRGRLNCFFFIF